MYIPEESTTDSTNHYGIKPTAVGETASSCSGSSGLAHCSFFSITQKSTTDPSYANRENPFTSRFAASLMPHVLMRVLGNSNTDGPLERRVQRRRFVDFFACDRQRA